MPSNTYPNCLGQYLYCPSSSWCSHELECLNQCLESIHNVDDMLWKEEQDDNKDTV